MWNTLGFFITKPLSVKPFIKSMNTKLILKCFPNIFNNFIRARIGFYPLSA